MRSILMKLMDPGFLKLSPRVQVNLMIWIWLCVYFWNYCWFLGSHVVSQERRCYDYRSSRCRWLGSLWLTAYLLLLISLSSRSKQWSKNEKGSWATISLVLINSRYFVVLNLLLVKVVKLPLLALVFHVWRMIDSIISLSSNHESLGDDGNRMKTFCRLILHCSCRE